MGRIDGRNPLAAAAKGLGREPRKGAALGAMAMDNVNPLLPRNADRGENCKEIERARQATHGDARHTKPRDGGELLEHPLTKGVGAAFGAKDRNRVAVGNLAMREIGDMAKEPAEGRPQAMEDAQPPEGAARALDPPIGSGVGRIVAYDVALDFALDLAFDVALDGVHC